MSELGNPEVDLLALTAERRGTVIKPTSRNPRFYTVKARKQMI